MNASESRAEESQKALLSRRRKRVRWMVWLALSFIIAPVPRQRHRESLGLFNFIRQLARGFGTSISVTLWDRRASFHDYRLTTHPGSF